MLDAQRAVYDLIGGRPDAFIPLEIGGGNGLQGAYTPSCDTSLTIDVLDQASCSVRHAIWTHRQWTATGWAVRTQPHGRRPPSSSAATPHNVSQTQYRTATAM
jgi:hypothetical protein